MTCESVIKTKIFLIFLTNGKLTWSSIGREGWRMAFGKDLRVKSEKKLEE